MSDTDDRARSRTYYDAFSTHYEHGRDRGYHRWLDERSAALVAPVARGSRVLEVGCGTGLVLERIAPIAREAVGADLSAKMLAHARRRGLTVVQAAAESLPFADGTFDVTYSFKVLAHVPDIDAALREMARVTRSGGLLLLEFYNRQSLRHLVRRLRRPGRIGRDRTEDDVFTRFDRLDELRARLPPGLRLQGVEGLRIATVVPQVFTPPGLGPAWAAFEDTLSRTPLRRFGGFLVLRLTRN